jgi:hypothetical protein
MKAGFMIKSNGSKFMIPVSTIISLVVIVVENI